MPPSPRDAAGYLLSLPERALRSLSALAGGLLREVGGAALPAALRRTLLYRSMVDAVTRFLVEQVGQVEGVFPAEGRLSEDFLLRRTAGNGIELLGVLTFRASPVWVLAVLADLSGAGKRLIGEIAKSLREEGLIEASAEPSTVEQLLEALERATGTTAEAINTPPLDVAGLRREWDQIREQFRAVPATLRPKPEEVERQWEELQQTAQQEQRSVFELSATMALSALTALPERVSRFGRSTRVGARRAGEVFHEQLLEHYSRTLGEIRGEGFSTWWARQFRPYLRGAAASFSPGRESLTERYLRKRRG